MKALAAAAVLLVVTCLSAFAGDPTAGEAIFKRNCIVCHAIGPGAATRVGPELNGVIGRKAGSVPGYNYSQANKTSGIVWDEATFTKYIADPRGVVPDEDDLRRSQERDRYRQPACLSQAVRTGGKTRAITCGDRQPVAPFQCNSSVRRRGSGHAPGGVPPSGQPRAGRHGGSAPIFVGPFDAAVFRQAQLPRNYPN